MRKAAQSGRLFDFIRSARGVLVSTCFRKDPGVQMNFGEGLECTSSARFRRIETLQEIGRFNVAAGQSTTGPPGTVISRKEET